LVKKLKLHLGAFAICNSFGSQLPVPKSLNDVKQLTEIHAKNKKKKSHVHLGIGKYNITHWYGKFPCCKKNVLYAK